ncbi:hypothetical protein CDD83_3191 [Cordyceps sp. RAO-2017]|nr:hypothetical protein CDD83_3191 [Cordyceps sp. RAO-2017]
MLMRSPPPPRNTHKDLTTLSEAEMEKEMTDLEATLSDILGSNMCPRYMRPPFFSTNEAVLGVMKRLNYHVIDAAIDTKDFIHNTPDTNIEAQKIFKDAIAKNLGTISLMHDVHQTTVELLVPEAIKALEGKKSTYADQHGCLPA